MKELYADLAELHLKQGSRKDARKALRHAITLDQLMRMSSGLAFGEGYFNPYSDVLAMPR